MQLWWTARVLSGWHLRARKPLSNSVLLASVLRQYTEVFGHSDSDETYLQGRLHDNDGLAPNERLINGQSTFWVDLETIMLCLGRDENGTSNRLFSHTTALFVGRVGRTILCPKLFIEYNTLKERHLGRFTLHFANVVMEAIHQ